MILTGTFSIILFPVPTMIFKLASLTGFVVLSALPVTVEAAAAASGDQDKMHDVLKEVILKGVHSASVRGLQKANIIATAKDFSTGKQQEVCPVNNRRGLQASMYDGVVISNRHIKLGVTRSGALNVDVPGDPHYPLSGCWSTIHIH
jgi:hypothetical protein